MRGRSEETPQPDCGDGTDRSRSAPNCLPSQHAQREVPAASVTATRHDRRSVFFFQHHSAPFESGRQLLSLPTTTKPHGFVSSCGSGSQQTSSLPYPPQKDWTLSYVSISSTITHTASNMLVHDIVHDSENVYEIKHELICEVYAIQSVICSVL